MEIGNLISLDAAKEKLPVIQWFYDQEEEYFFKHIHKRSGTKEECVKDTFETISDTSKMYLVFYGYELAAFFVKFENDTGQSLEGFHVLKEYRNRVFLSEFWKLIKRVMGGVFYTGIYCKNEPAIRFLVNAGCTVQTLAIYNKQPFLIFKSE